jgi:hypothetical protein
MGDGLVDEGVGVRHSAVILGAELRSSQRDSYATPFRSK